MIAWVSPCFTVRSTPRRISVGPPSVSTETCRSLISSVAMGTSGLLGDGDEHIVPFDLYGVYGDGPGGGRPGGLSGTQVEAGAVQPALDLAVLHLALGERDVGVRADVVDGVHLPLRPHDGHRHAVELHPVGGVLFEVAQRHRVHVADVRPSGSGHATDASSSASILAISRSSTSGRPIFCTSSAKKPRTTSRRASCSG